MILTRPVEFVQIVQKGKPPREYVWSAISNMAGDLVESGQYHCHRGWLNPLGPGEDLLRLFDLSIDEVLRMGAIKPDFASEQKAAVRRNLRDVG